MTTGDQPWLTSLPVSRQQELLERHAAFWRRTPGSGPLLGFAPTSRVFPLQNLNMQHEGRLTPETITEAVLRSDTEYLPPIDPEDDLFPGKIPLEPLAWSESYTGANIFMSTAALTVWAEPGSQPPRTLAEVAARLQPAWLDKLVEATRVNVEAAGGELLLTEPLLRGPADCLEALIGAGQLCYRLCDEPETLAEITGWLADRVIELARAQAAVLPPFHGGMLNRYRLWAPGLNVVTQADISTVMSPAHFREVFLPAYRKVAQAFDTVTIHFHSSAHQHVKALLEIEELAAIEWGLDPTGPTLEELVPVFARILDSKCVIVMNLHTDAEVAMLLDRLPHEGLCLIQRKAYPEGENL
jgi:hypothetical protein